MDDFLADLNEENPEAIVLKDLDDAIVGMAHQHTKPTLVVYDRDLILQILHDRDGLTWEEADEYCSFNIDCLWAGEGTPLILQSYRRGNLVLLTSANE